MKTTTVKITAFILMSAILVCALASCGKTVSGSYEAEIELLGQSWNVTYSFSGKKVEVVSKLTFLGKVTTKTTTGTYEIVADDDGNMEITFDFEEETDLFKDGTVTFEETEEYIKLAGIKYNKVN